MKCCKTCGAVLKETRYGVAMSPLKARIFDLVEKRPGITRREIAAIVYGNDRDSSNVAIGSHVKQIRELFMDHESISVIGRAHHGISVKVRRRAA